MTKVQWTLERIFPAQNVTSSVLSMNYVQGRQNYSDPYSGGTLNVTLNNQNNVAQYFAFNEYFRLKDNLSPGGGFPFLTEQHFWVQEVTFNDYPGNVGLSTITVSLVDVLARNGRVNADNVSLSSGDVNQQLNNLWLGYGGIGNAQGTGGSSTMRAINYTGSFLNYFNLLMSTEQGALIFREDEVLSIGRNAVATYVSGSSFTRNSPTATAISYNQFDHVRAGLNFINEMTVSPTGLATQTAENTTSIATYGIAQRSMTTVDNTTTQALGLAQWFSSALADPNSETWSVSFTDIPQTSVALITVLETFYGSGDVVYDLVYRVPGAGSDTTIEVVVEGIGISATPDKTEFTVYFSPLTYYQFFTLDSTTLGILNTSRLGW